MLFLIAITRDLRKVIHLKGGLLFSFFCLLQMGIRYATQSYRRWITLAIISFSGGVSFDWLIYVIFIKFPWRNLWDSANRDRFNNEYLWYCGYYSLCPSGVIADKFSHRKMITSAMIIPDYWVC